MYESFAAGGTIINLPPAYGASDHYATPTKSNVPSRHGTLGVVGKVMGLGALVAALAVPMVLGWEAGRNRKPDGYTPQAASDYVGKILLQREIERAADPDRR